MSGFGISVRVFLFVKLGVIILGGVVSSFSAAHHLRAAEDTDAGQGATATYARQMTQHETSTWETLQEEHYSQSSNHEDLNCTIPSIVRFPPSLFTQKQREHGAVIINALTALYLFGALGYVCSVYFVPSLEIISKMLGIQEDVAGATFMAIGSSAPELFSAVIGTFVTHDDTGFCAILGSAAFNFLGVISLCTIFAGGSKGLQLLWYPVMRDSIFWAISVILLIVVTYDTRILWWESLIMSLCFVGYIIIMYFNKPLSAYAMAWTAPEWFPSSPCRGSSGDVAPNDPEDELEEVALIEGNSEGPVGGSGWGDDADYVYVKESLDEEEEDARTETDVSSKDDSSIPSVFDAPTSTWMFIAWLLGFPVIFVLHYTVPDCRKPGTWQRFYLVTFLMSTLWLAIFSYLLYWMVVVIGYTIGIPDSVMGYTVLAIGTSVPDAIASVLVARDGFADMAVANIIGSNVFETCICLGFVWFMRSMSNMPFAAPVEVKVDGLTLTAFFLLLVVSLTIILIHINSWRLDCKIGVVSFVVYIIFIVLVTLNTEGVFAFGGHHGQKAVQEQPCPTNVLSRICSSC